MTFKSKAEEAFYHRNKHLGIIPAGDKFFPVLFKDSNNEIFRAQPDFEYFDLYIEYKDDELHSLSTKERCRTARQNKERNAKHYSNYSEGSTQRKCDWNHSYIKQQIVTETLLENGIKLLIVFPDKLKKKPPNKFTKYTKLGLYWCFESDLKEHLDAHKNTGTFTSGTHSQPVQYMQ